LCNSAGFELAELRSALKEDHVYACHPPAQMIGRAELADDVAEHHAYCIGRTRGREAQKCK
jgi:hypothetical protein